MLRRLCQQLSWQQLQRSPIDALSQALSHPVAQQTPQLQLLAQYSQRLNPQQQRKQQKQQKKQQQKSRKDEAQASSTSESTSFKEDSQAFEPDITKLVLQAITNVTPLLDVRTVRTATKVSYVPGLMPPKKARSLALHWLVRAADTRAKSSNAKYAECLALELLLAYQKKGAARQKRDDIHKLALQNRANIHLRWW
eukprot:GHRR01010352.1.p1 GENE.GHRR01010352.1~~GHRR01010352.1.p1  ORF type:complete len:196 (+),score=53.10 GHRR01010352.1:565-1152(+)